MDAIRGRSRWLRKAPLELSHASRPLLEGGQSRLLLFAAGSAAKEQWHAALAAACAPDGGPGAAIEALYEAFCERARAAASVPYAQVPCWHILGRQCQCALLLHGALVGCYDIVVNCCSSRMPLNFG